MLLRKEEIQKIAAEILKKLSAAPSISLRGDMNRTTMGGKGGGATVNLTPGVANPMGMEVGKQPQSALPTGVSNESTSKT